MWPGPGQDPEGGPDPDPPSTSTQQELSDLENQQQVLITQLKEMMGKSEQSSVTQEKVDEYMNTLSRHSKAKKTKKGDISTRKTIDIPASQKINLLRQQVEENKLKLAERGKSQKGIEEMVTQLKAQLDDSQNMINQVNVGQSVLENKEYNENSTAKELYSILLIKERRICDLSNKVHKLETNVLDLQENLKEKDSVIDARTKAITLMSESLSKKGKSTLDALEETKEQMRKMQENFIKLEDDMKARQMNLLDNLRIKNYEIAEFQENITKLDKEKNDLIEELNLYKNKEETDGSEVLKSELSENKDEINNLQDIINKIKAENVILSSQLAQKESEESGDNEVVKLKKQLEESNKNMIKVKAQSKSKIKELTKKIEQFKKISDVNAEIVRLETENCKLGQKIAELEEEKGALQLKMVESDHGKSSEDDKRFESCEILEKDKIISILEAGKSFKSFK